MKDFNNFLETELNKNQIEAVKDKNGCFLVIAGAGSGKTRVITTRITNLILNHNVQPSEIIALTFTNKAAREMKGRIQKFLSDRATQPSHRSMAGTNLPFIGTFHSFCLMLLKKNKSFHDLQNFSILDDDDQLKLIKLILHKFALNKQHNATQIQYQISTLKNKNLTESLESIDELHMSGQHIIQILNEYEKEKRKIKCLDFDDLLIEVVKLFKTNPTFQLRQGYVGQVAEDYGGHGKKFKENFQSSVKHILVDEYQDTNKVQHELLKEMCGQHDSICAVGDEDQSIYSWRGAVVDNIINFKNDFPDTKIIKIEQNYRSVNQILDVANSIIRNNKNRHEKKLWSEKTGKNRVLRITSFSGTKEAELVASYVKLAQSSNSHFDQAPGSAKATPGKQYSLRISGYRSIAVLYRTHFQSRLIEEAFLREGINYKIIGGIQFYERKEVKDILAYLKLIANPFDKVSFFRVLNCPTRGIGKKTEELIALEWDLQPLLNFKELIKKTGDENKLPSSKTESLDSFCNLFNKFTENDSPASIIKELIGDLEYVLYLKSEFDKKDAESRLENLDELIRAADYFTNSKDDQFQSRTIKDFLDEVSLLQDQLKNNDEENIQVQLMTLHAAKGLEFDHVIIVGLEEGLLPSSRSLQSEEAIEEERRLFYVGITRAKEYLLICNAQLRNTYGQTETQIRSRFIDEIPNHKIHTFNHTNYNNYDLEILLRQFLGVEQKFKPSVLTFEKQFEKEPILNEWKKNHFAKHTKFGIGLIKEIENKPDSTILTVQFKNVGIKKINSKFLEKI